MMPFTHISFLISLPLNDFFKGKKNWGGWKRVLSVPIGFPSAPRALLLFLPAFFLAFLLALLLILLAHAGHPLLVGFS